jgi:hypothetical protein
MSTITYPRIVSPVTGVETITDAGCWVDGHWGQYAAERLYNIAVGHGVPVPPIPEVVDDGDLVGWFWDISDEVLDALNAATDAAHTWCWADGELFCAHVDELEDLFF